MICPVEIASDLSALRAARVGDHAEHGGLLEGRDGAGDESAGSHLTGHGEEDYVVQAAEIIGISDRQMRRWRERLEEFGYDGLFDRRRGQPFPQASSSGHGGAGLGDVSGSLFRSERAAFSREARRAAMTNQVSQGS